MFGELRLLVHGELFERVGLKLVQHPDGQTVLLQCLNGHQQPEGVELATAKKITPMVRSSELFVDFLTGFHPEVANRDAELLGSADRRVAGASVGR